MQSTTRFTCTFKVNLYSLNIQLSRCIIDIFPANRLLSDELTSPRAGFLVGVILDNCALYIFTNWGGGQCPNLIDNIHVWLFFIPEKVSKRGLFLPIRAHQRHPKRLPPTLGQILERDEVKPHRVSSHRGGRVWKDGWGENKIGNKFSWYGI